MKDTSHTQRFVEISPTKFHIPPLRPRLLERHSLVESIQKGLYRKLTLLCAPAGFGKTTLAASVARASARRLLWLSLEPWDDEPARLARLLVQVCRPLWEQEPSFLLEALESFSPQHLEPFLSALFHAIEAAKTPFLLILDDWHEIQAEPCLRLFSCFLEHCPSQGHVLITSRQTPSLPLHRWYARDWVQEFSVMHLSFQEDEISDFFSATMQMELSKEQSQTLQAQTDGWIAGLQLVGLSLQRHPLALETLEGVACKAPYLEEYIQHELLSQLEDQEREFLIEISILDWLSGPLCTHVTGQHESEARLVSFERRHLFVMATHPERRWFRLHSLLAEALRQKLKNSDMKRFRGLHRRASVWFAEVGEREQAIKHSMLAEDWELCVELLLPSLEELLLRQAFGQVLGWLEKLPESVRNRVERLRHARLWSILGLGRWDDAAERELAELSTLAQARQEKLSTQERPSMDAELLFLKAYRAASMGHFAESTALAQEAIQSLPLQLVPMRFTLMCLLTQDPAWLARQEGGDLWFSQEIALLEGVPFSPAVQHFVQQTTLSFQSWFAYHRGDLFEAISILEKALALPWKKGTSGRRWEHASALAYFYWEQGRLDEAWSAHQEAKHCFDPAYQDAHTIAFYQTAALVCHARGASDEAYDWLTQGASYTVTRAPQEQEGIEQVRLFLKSLEGDLDYLKEWVRKRGLSVFDEGPLVSEERQIPYLLLGGVLLAEQRLEEVESLLSRFEAELQPTTQVPLAISVAVFRALHQEFLEQREKALHSLRFALRLASKGHYLSTFLAQEEPLCRLLCSLLATPEQLCEDCSPTFLSALLDALPLVRSKLNTETEGKRTKYRLDVSGETATLSKREQEVLQEAAAGKTYREIGKTLHISVETVKQHMKNIFQKLHVSNRTQALVKAQALRLISSR